MAVTCREILKLDICSRLKVVGGCEGLDRTVTWPYIKNVDSISGWVHGGELIFVVGSRDDVSEAGLLNLMTEAMKNNVSGVVLLIGDQYIRQIPRSMIGRADDYKLPLFRMPFRLKLIDVTHEISRFILENQRLEKSRTSFPEKSVTELLLKGADKEEILTYCYQRLQPVMDADRVMKTDYLFTLRKYLECNNDLLHTAEAIYIHRNTMYNRMKKITALMGEDLNSQEVRCDLWTVFQILEYYGEL